MSDLIRREDAIKALQELDMLKESRWSALAKADPIQFVCRMYLETENVIEAIPSAEPERKTGEWTEKEVFTSGKGKIREWQSAKCSVCGKYLTTPYLYYFDEQNFCPHCGADMRGKNGQA